LNEIELCCEVGLLLDFVLKNCNQVNQVLRLYLGVEAGLKDVVEAKVPSCLKNDWLFLAFVFLIRAKWLVVVQRIQRKLGPDGFLQHLDDQP
jgi:hypothetical protein